MKKRENDEHELCWIFPHEKAHRKKSSLGIATLPPARKKIHDVKVKNIEKLFCFFIFLHYKTLKRCLPHTSMNWWLTVLDAAPIALHVQNPTGMHWRDRELELKSIPCICGRRCTSSKKRIYRCAWTQFHSFRKVATEFNRSIQIFIKHFQSSRSRSI